MKKIIYIILIMFMAGCVNGPLYDTSVFSISPSVKLNYIQDNSYVRDRDNQLIGQITGQPSKNQQVYYKVDWFDSNGMQIDTTLSQWKRVSLKQYVDFHWKLVAPTKRASYYKVYIVDKLGDGLMN